MLAEGGEAVQCLEVGARVPADRVLEVLGEVIDPELGLDLVTLGLVYEVHVAGGAVTVVMTLTTPGCPMHAAIEADAYARLGAVEGIEAVDVQIVWDPPWSPARITEAGRRQLFGP